MPLRSRIDRFSSIQPRNSSRRSGGTRTVRQQRIIEPPLLPPGRTLPSRAHSADPKGYRVAVSDREDRREVARVRSDRLVHLLDGIGPGRVAELLGLGRSRDPSRPQGVVADVEAPDSDPVARRAPRLRVPMLVDVAVDDVELTFQRIHRLDRVPHVELDWIPQPGPLQVVASLLLVLRVAIGEVELAAGSEGSGEPVARIPEPGTELDD